MDSTVSKVLEADPYLQYQPSLAYTLPIQLLVNGITGTLLTVLLIHLLFTTQYHYPLAPLNYFLQLSSIVTVLISVVIKIVVILRHCAHLADKWPYYLDYVAVTVPPTSWSTAQNAAWFLLQALNAGLSNIAHIQFLTLLYPSRIEARLIIFVLGPLAVVSSVLVFTALSPSQTVLDISDAIRNVFNSTLLLIFTISLAIWGLFVNRRRAWRFDGGTAAFGVGSLFLAMISTSFNFVAVAEDGIDWLQHLLFAAILWQIWLGWWWWVGSGMGIGEVEDIMVRAERKKRKQAKAAARVRTADARNRREAGALDERRRQNSLAGIADGLAFGVTSILRTSRTGTLTRRATRRSTADEAQAEEGAMEMDDLRHRRTDRAGVDDDHHVEFSAPDMDTVGGGSSANRGHQISTNSEASSTSATPSLHAPHTFSQLLSYPSTWFVVYLRRLRKAHQEATKKAAIERAERRLRVFPESYKSGRQERGARLEAGIVNEDDIGWGLGRFGIREHEESARRLREAGEMLNDERLLAEFGNEADRTGRVECTERGAEAREEWEDIDTSSGSANTTGNRREQRGRRRVIDEQNETGQKQGSGWSWWGPLKEWRLNDRQVY
ncbi:uncharacterized protein L203_101346 [Cryptococcus depauperatus CBS 7841]|uniref:Uncharacterized protein n=1 Tax=Cryptococcus depauperatus CBS 7841 TaxID=1295531 RepID=A0A1E3IE14_9TREE|nr:hypothetical protein L203_04294 [Cryptococcus depauperatus CBS 7841]